MEGFQEPTGQIDAGFDADAAFDAIESGGSYEGVEQPEQSNAQQGVEDALQADKTQAQPPQTVPAAQELKFKWNGQEITVPANDPRLTQWASQGYDYAQKMQAFNQERAQLEQQLQAKYAQYQPIDEYVQQNPQFWDHVLKTYEQQQMQGLDPADPVQKQILELKEQLKPVGEFIKQSEQAKLTQQREAEDQALNAEIQSIREQYKDLDWAGVDASGKSLEVRILEHAAANKLSSFKVAARDLLHDDLMKKAEERAKEAVMKDIQSKRKAGLLGTTPAPTKGIRDAENIKNKSWDQLYTEALEDLRGA